MGVAKEIISKCTKLELAGLMTIGSTEASYSEALNPDFESLVECKARIEKELGVENLELSMGMSEDYISAIKQGSTSVRVGSKIFGSRQPKA